MSVCACLCVCASVSWARWGRQPIKNQEERGAPADWLTLPESQPTPVQPSVKFTPTGVDIPGHFPPGTRARGWRGLFIKRSAIKSQKTTTLGSRSRDSRTNVNGADAASWETRSGRRRTNTQEEGLVVEVGHEAWRSFSFSRSLPLANIPTRLIRLTSCLDHDENRCNGMLVYSAT